MDKAIADYSTAIKLAPNFAQIYDNRGNAYQDKGSYDHAIKDYTQAIQLNPSDVNTYNNRGVVSFKKRRN